MEDYIINLVALGVISWTTLFLFTRKVFQKRSFDFCNRLVSTIHATLAVALASLSVQDWSSPISPLASASSPQQMQTLAVSVAYLMYDLVCCQFDNNVKIDTAIHHLVSIVGLGAGLAHQRCGTEMVAASIMVYRDLQSISPLEGAPQRTRILFATVFTSSRMIGGQYLTYVTLSANNPLLIKAMALGLQLVSAFWFYKIARMVIYKLSRRTSSRKLKSS